MTDLSANRPTVAKIDLEALAFNLRSSRSFMGAGQKIMAVVKADAYGHGSVPCALRLEQEGADILGVATSEEAFELRNAGVKGPILCLGGLWPGQELPLVKSQVTVSIFRLEHAELLDRAARELGTVVGIQVKIDTGMGRVGIPVSECAEFAERLASLGNIRVEGLMTHFAVADDLTQTDFTQNQIEAFKSCTKIFENAGHDPEYLNLANSPGAVAHPASRSNLVRLGGILYGLGGDVLPAHAPQPELKPVMRIETRIADIKSFSEGSSLGYGRTFVTSRPSRIALVPIGYHDGLPRVLSNVGRMLVRGQSAPIVGRVSMDWTLIDVTDIEGAGFDDLVTVIGRDCSECVRAEDLAKAAGTISYEITCGIGPRVPRLYDQGA